MREASIWTINDLFSSQNADRFKYGTRFTGLSSQYSLGQDQYPKTIFDANSVLSNHRFDPTYMDNKKKKRDRERIPGTFTQRQQQEHSLQLSFAQMERFCYFCRKRGHKLPACRFKSKPRTECAFKKTLEVLHVQSIRTRRASPAVTERTENRSESKSLNTTSQTQNPPCPWTGAQMSRSGVSAAQTT
jgi:hypothetical protein